MPTYEYKCKNCGKIFEVFQSITDDPIKTCPDCGGEVYRLISGGIGIIFKGNGFYVTDNKTNSSYNGKSKQKETANSSNTKNDNKKSVKDKK